MAGGPVLGAAGRADGLLGRARPRVAVRLEPRRRRHGRRCAGAGVVLGGPVRVLPAAGGDGKEAGGAGRRPRPRARVCEEGEGGVEVAGWLPVGGD